MKINKSVILSGEIYEMYKKWVKSPIFGSELFVKISTLVL